MSTEAVYVILGMAAVTFAIRMGGLLVANRLPATGFVAAWLRHVPGAVLAALIAPAVLAGGVAEWLAAAVTALVFVLIRNLFAAMVGGVVAVWLLRQWFGA
jgi:uncharacterized membrane protein